VSHTGWMALHLHPCAGNDRVISSESGVHDYPMRNDNCGPDPA
jgi:hypothetical protein